jgi:phosphate:Na+ symporter
MQINFSDAYTALAAFLGGIGLFLFGLRTMSDGLQLVAGKRLKSILTACTARPWTGLLLGTFVTALIQSSSATTVLTVGLVNAGLLTLKQAVSVVLGANIGTTFTAWLVSWLAVFKISNYALPAIGIGLILNMAGGRRILRNYGQVLLGFGMLFLGISFMKDAFEPLAESTYVMDLFVRFGNQPLLAVVVGAVFTMLLQSSSATITITQLLAFQGLIPLPGALGLILGDNIGTTITAELASLGSTDVNAKRTARAHTLFNVIGVAYILIFLYTGIYQKAVEWIVPSEGGTSHIMTQIAVAHSMFNIFNALVFLPNIGLLIKLASLFAPDKKGDQRLKGPQLVESLLDSPEMAMESVQREILKMLEIAYESVESALYGLQHKDEKSADRARLLEKATDAYQQGITGYLVSLAQLSLERSDAEQIPVMIHTVNDLERIGDHAVNLSELAMQAMIGNHDFGPEADREISVLGKLVREMVEKTRSIPTENGEEAFEHVQQIEEEINRRQIESRVEHSLRLSKGEIPFDSALSFVDVVDNLEKVADHLTNVAEGLHYRNILPSDEKKTSITHPIDLSEAYHPTKR